MRRKGRRCINIFATKRCAPPFLDDGWYWHEEHEYNKSMYQPTGWEQSCRFTDEKGRPHQVIKRYDQRADAENLIGEAQRQGVLAIQFKRFQAHHAFFQIVMLAYNLWRWMKLLAGHCERQKQKGSVVSETKQTTMADHTIRIARLKMLFVAAKVRFHGNRDEVRYSIHESQAAGIMD